MMYVDPDVELAWFIPVIFGLVGGGLNLAANWDNIDGFWDGLSTFAVGAAAGVASSFTGGASIGVQISVGAAGGALTSFNNSLVAQTGKNFDGMSDVNWSDVGRNTLSGTLAGGAGAGVGHWAANSGLMINNINSPLLRSVSVAPIASGAGHVMAGTSYGVLNGQNLGDAFASSFDGIERSMITATVTAGATTVAISYAQGMNPLTGEKTRGFSIQKRDNSNLIKSKRSLEEQIKLHQQKKADYIKNPDKYDNQGYLKNAGSDQALRQRIIEGRIRHLDHEIRTFQDQIDQINKQIKR